MRSEFDPLRSAPLPDSFERTAAWLREAPPPRPRRAPATMLVALLLIIGACSWPVNTTVAAGSVLELLSTDRIGVGHPTLVALDRLVPDDHQHLLELAGVGDEGSQGTVVRYAVLGADQRSVVRWRDTMATMPGIEAVRVVKLDVTERRPFGVFTVRRVLGVSSTPHLTDAELQTELDRVFADTLPITIHVQRTLSGQRVLNLGDHVTLKMRPGARISTLPALDASTSGLVVEGIRPGDTDIDKRIIGRRGATDEVVSVEGVTSIEVALDSLSPDMARAIRDRLDANLRQIDSLYVHGNLPSDTSSQVFFLFRSDTLRRPLPPGARVDTVRRFIRIHTLRDSL